MTEAHDIADDSVELRKPIDLEAGRRAFLKAAGLGGIVATLAALPETAHASDLDATILNFALNLEYLEAEFYLHAVTGNGLPSNLIGGLDGTGAVTGGRQVNFQNSTVAALASELAHDESAHVAVLRSVLGNGAEARPAIDIGNSFTVAARAAGVIGANATFDPYASDVNFLLASYIFEDVGVTAYHGAAALVTNKNYLAAASSILGVEAYHAGAIRTLLFAMQSSFATTATAQISALRAFLSEKKDDQGIGADQSTLAGGLKTPSNIVPTDANSIAFARTPREVLNVVYGARNASKGLFFPNGVNGGSSLKYLVYPDPVKKKA